MLTADQRAEFDEKGFVRVPSAFSREQALAMEERVWRWLERRYGISRTERASWSVSVPTGLQGLKRQAVFEAIGSATTRAVLDDLLGPDGWRQPRDWGGFLVNFPSAGPWSVPSRVWLAALTSEHEDPARVERLMCEGAVVAGVPVRVVEVAGAAGDLVIGHHWLLHAGAPNCGSRPRMMRVQRVQAS